MNYTSIAFLLFVTVTLAAYYLFPVKKYQWTVLLAASIFFYCYASFRYSAYLLFSICSTYAVTILIDRLRTRREAVLAEHKAEWSKAERKCFKKETERIAKVLCAVALVFNFSLLAFLKYYNFTVDSLSRLLNLPALGNATVRLILPLGISFYTFQAMGYVIDVSRGTVPVQKNLGKLALFMCFFPQIIQGPIGVYSHLADQLYTPHSADYERFRSGAELILWGFLKKLVIADRAFVAIRAVTADYTAFDGSALLFTTLLYCLQIYADFSGGIDISRGISEMLGIQLAENFKRPYFAVSVNDFWRRWHITLGAWMRNYLFYPVVLSRFSRKLSDRLKATNLAKSKAGMHVISSIPACIGTLTVFLIVGIWHGAGSRYIAYGLWNGIIITISILLEPVFLWQNAKLGISADSRLLHAFRVIRTFVLVAVSNVTDLAPTMGACFDWIFRIFTCFFPAKGVSQIWEHCGLVLSDFCILLAGALLLFVVSLVQESSPEITIRSRINRFRLPFRWGILLAGLAAVIVFGQYGPAYDAAAFVYMQF